MYGLVTVIHLTTNRNLISYVLAHWAQLQTAIAPVYLPDWGEAAEIVEFADRKFVWMLPENLRLPTGIKSLGVLQLVTKLHNLR